MARPIVLIPHLFRLADAINFKKDYSPPSSRHLDPFRSARLGFDTPKKPLLRSIRGWGKEAQEGALVSARAEEEMVGFSRFYSKSVISQPSIS